MNSKIAWSVIVGLFSLSLGMAEAKHYEVFLLAGQSNMDGRGKVKDLQGELASYAAPRSDVLIRFSGGGLVRPLTVSNGLQPLAPGFSGTPGNPAMLPTDTFGPEVSFGPAMAAALPGKNILLIKVAEGGTNLRTQWSPKEKGMLYERFIEFIRDTEKLIQQRGDTCAIRGMLWHQGESDAALPEGEYQQLLGELISSVRSDLGEFPFLIGQVYDNGKRRKVIEAQKAVAQSVPKTAFVECEGLNTFDQGTHFDAPSQIELGKRFAREMVRLLQPPTPSKPQANN